MSWIPKDDPKKPNFGDYIVQYVPYQEIGSFGFVTSKFCGELGNSSTHWHPLAELPHESEVAYLKSTSANMYETKGCS